MSMPPTDALLQTLAANVRLFRGMTKPQLVSLLTAAERKTAPAGHFFFEEGEPGASFHVIIGGSAAVFQKRNGRRIDLARLSAGDCFGEMCLVGMKTRSATVRAMEDTLTLCFARERVDALPGVAAAIYRNIATVLVSRLVQSNETVAELMLQHDDGEQQPHIYGIRPTRTPPT